MNSSALSHGAAETLNLRGGPGGGEWGVQKVDSFPPSHEDPQTYFPISLSHRGMLTSLSILTNRITSKSLRDCSRNGKANIDK